MKQKENTPPTRLSGTKGKYAGFTLIELLVSISILATISIVAYVSISGHMKIANNATRIAAIDSLHLSLRDYYQMKKILPEPNSNYVVYDERGTYMHSFSGAYGVSGHVSYDFLPAGYVNFEATDPESHQFYGYGKTLGSKTESDNDENDAKFDVAAVLYDEKTGGYKTYIRGTYEKQRLSSLIRAYSSSNFVSQDSTEDLPYNPYERKVTAYISSFSGTLSLTVWGTIIPSITSPASYTGELNSGDIITIGTGSTALVHISDGSELSLGSTQSQTILALSSLEYNDDTNLTSQVALWLKSGEVWTEAPHLRTEADSASDFSIQTDSALAAVRGTVFGIAKNPLTDITAISLKVGTLEVSKITTKENGEILSQTGFTSSNGFSSTATGGFVSSGSLSYMIVPENGTPIKLDGIQNPTLEGGTIPPTSTGSLNPYDIDRKINHPPFSLGYRPLADKISFTHTGAQAGTDTGTLSVTFQNYGADFYRLSFGTGEVNDENILNNPNPFYTGTLSIAPGPVTITGAFRYHDDVTINQYYTLAVCLRGVCSSSDIKNLPTNLFDWGPFYIWGEKKGTVPNTPVGDVTPPIAHPDNISTPFNTQKIGIDVLTNDDTDDSGVRPILTGALSNVTPGGAFAINATNTGTIDFTPMVGFTGSASVIYTIQDGSNNTATGLLTVTIECNQIQDACGYGLVAYAPYDVAGNLQLYQTGSSSLSPSWSGGNLSFSGVSGGSGVIVGTPSGYLKYNLDSLGLGNSFSIEMSVRGGALKRNNTITSQISYLLDSSSVYLDIYDTSAANPILYLWYKQNGIHNVKSIPISISLSNNLTDNDFYKIKAGFNGSVWSLTLVDRTNNIIAIWNDSGTGINITLNSDLFIGTPTTYPSQSYQWNDIIDYVKIYKY